MNYRTLRLPVVVKHNLTGLLLLGQYITEVTEERRKEFVVHFKGYGSGLSNKREHYFFYDTIAKTVQWTDTTVRINEKWLIETGPVWKEFIADKGELPFRPANGPSVKFITDLFAGTVNTGEVYSQFICKTEADVPNSKILAKGNDVRIRREDGTESSIVQVILGKLFG